MTYITSRLAVVALALTLSACGSRNEMQTGPLPAAGQETRVQVTNHNWSDMRVYVERDGMRVRLGTVTSMGSQTFKIPRALVNSSGNLRLIADPIGARELHVTQPVQVWPGQVVDFTIENHLAISSVAVWGR